MASDIELLAGLEGGGKLSGKSGQKIQNQLNNIIGHINKNPLKVKIDVDDTLFRRKLQQLTADAINEANKIKAAYKGIFPQNNSNGPGNNPPPPPPPPTPPKPPTNSITNYNNELAKTESLLKQVNKAHDQWTAANKTGSKTEPFYKDLAGQKKELEDLIDDLKKKDPTKLTVAKAREIYSGINARFRESARQIGFEDFDFNDDKRFQKLREANRELASMRKNMETWTASKNGASKSQFAIYAQQAAELEAAIKAAGSGGSIDALISKLAEVRSKAQEAANVIAQMHEARKAKDDIKKGEDGYRDALDKIRKQEDELRKQLSDWDAAGQDDSDSKKEYDKLKALIKEYKQLRQDLATGMRDANGGISFLNDEGLSKRLKELNTRADEYRKTIVSTGEDCKQLVSGNEDYYKALTKVNKEIDSAEKNQRSWAAAQDAPDDVASKYTDIENQVKKLKTLRDELEAGSLSANEFNLRLLEIQTSLAVDEGAIKNKGFAMTKSEEAEKFTKQLKEVDAALEQNEKNMREWSRAKTGSSKGAFSGLEGVEADLKKLRDDLIKTGHSVKEFDEIMAKAGESSAKFGARIKDANEDSKTLGDSVVGVFEQFGQYIDVMDVVFKGIEWGRQMVEAVTNIDTAMTELRKVTDETDATYSAFLETAATRAQNLGATVVDVVSSSADFARLGHDLGDASALADAALIYKNVGDGIKDIDTASSSIISTMQAFGIEAENAMSIVDSFNAIGKLNCRPVQQCTGEKVAISVKSQGWSRPREDSVINREPVETVIPHVAMYVVSLLPCLFTG